MHHITLYFMLHCVNKCRWLLALLDFKCQHGYCLGTTVFFLSSLAFITRHILWHCQVNYNAKVCEKGANHHIDRTCLCHVLALLCASEQKSYCDSAGVRPSVICPSDFLFIFVNMGPYRRKNFKRHVWKYTSHSLPKIMHTPRVGLYQSCLFK